MRLALALLVILPACTSPNNSEQRRLPASTRGPTVTVVDSVAIAEPDSLPLGNYAWPVARRSNGELFVLDPGVHKVLRFDRTGKLAGVIGREGEGPGELRSPLMIALLPGDTLLAVVDPNRSRLVVFGATDGVVRREAALPEFALADQYWSRRGDTVTFGLTASRAPIAVWPWKGNVISTRGTTPQRTRLVGLQFGQTRVVATDSGFVVLYPGQPGLFLLDRAGQATGFVSIPTARRVGEPADIRARQKALSKSERGKLVASLAAGLHRMSSGSWLLVHLDVDLKRVGDVTRSRDLRFYASVFSSDFQRVCVDGLLPVTSDAPAMPFFAGDTLFLFSRTVGVAGMKNTVYALTINTAGCDWQQTGGIVPPPRDSL
ncbi:MAG: 6-bladed beta-propeller [Gemmatimonadota bacterium]